MVHTPPLGPGVFAESVREEARIPQALSVPLLLAPMRHAIILAGGGSDAEVSGEGVKVQDSQTNEISSPTCV